MYEIERLVTILKPTQKFYDWLQTTPSLDKELTLEDLRGDCTALLLPTFETADEADDYLQKNITEIFSNECETWCEDESFWPKPFNYELFRELFNIEHHSMVFDLVDDEDSEEDEDDYEEEDDFEDDEDEEEDK